MIIRTISQLPRTQESVPEGSLIEVSIKRDNEKYISKAMPIELLEEQMKDCSSKYIAEKFHLYDSTDGNMDVHAMYIDIHDLKHNDDIVISGTKKFNNLISYTDNVMTNTDLKNKNWQRYNQNDNEFDARIASVGYVISAMKRGSIFASSETTLDGFSTTDGQIATDTTKIMSFYFDKTRGLRTSTEYKTPASGQLVAYGWLADTGNVDTASAWVALEAYINESWVILALQPWIVGTKHSNMQYVGFNVMVSQDLYLRFSTGFDLNYDNSTYQGRPNSLVINKDSDKTNITNAFIGYVIH